MSTTNDNPETSQVSLASLSGLPEELCLAVIEQCDMPSIIALSQTSHHFHRLANPKNDCRRAQMQEFLTKAQTFPRWQPQDWEKYRDGWRRCGYACYTCKQVLPSDRFADKDVKGTAGPQGRRYNKRCCVQCGLKTGRLPPGSVVKQGTTRRFVCRPCKELKGGRTCDGCKICRDCDFYGFEILACEMERHSC